MDIVKEIKDSFKEGTYLTKLIYINISVFVLINIIFLILFLFNNHETYGYLLIKYLAVPADIKTLVYMPWTIITYMFLHQDFLHLLFNILWLYWFGKIFLEYINQKKLLSVYILGGIFGALLYIISFNIFPVFQPFVFNSVALGASASVLAIVVAISFYIPNYTINLFLIGRVKLKYIAIVSIFIDILSIANSNPGGHIAHLGGAMFGYIFIMYYKKNIFITKWLEKILDYIFTIFKPRHKIKITYNNKSSDYQYNARKQSDQKDVDKILEKISKSGYSSLTKDEKETLFKMSKN